MTHVANRAFIGDGHPWRVFLRDRFGSKDLAEVEVPTLGAELCQPVEFARASGFFYRRYRLAWIADDMRVAAANYAGLARVCPLYPIGKSLNPNRIP